MAEVSGPPTKISPMALGWFGFVPLVLGAMMIVSGSLSIHEDKDLSKPVVSYQSVVLAFGCAGVILAVLMMFMGFYKQKGLSLSTGGRNALGARRSWYPDMM